MERIYSSPSLVAKLECLKLVLQTEIKVAKQDYRSYLIKQFVPSRDSVIYHHIKFLSSRSPFPGQMHVESTRATSDSDKVTLFTIISSLCPCQVPLSFLALRVFHRLLLVLVTLKLVYPMFTVLLIP